MRDGLGRAQSMLLVGGTSQIGIALADRLVPRGRLTLAGRDAAALQSAAERLATPFRRVDIIGYEACGPMADAADVVGYAVRDQDLDLIVVAVGALSSGSVLDADADAIDRLLLTNMNGPIGVVHAAARQLYRQGHGTLIVLSSVAGLRSRPDNFLYGLAKSGLDAFARRAGEELEGSGARVLVVRSGQVRTRMSAHLADPPLTVDTSQVADAVEAALRHNRSLVYVPALLRPVMAGLRALPTAAFRRLTSSRAGLFRRI